MIDSCGQLLYGKGKKPTRVVGKIYLHIGGTRMDDALARMKEGKRLRLINSAMKEFGANSYQKASTNVIVKDAGISKGLLYHYFDSKEDLYDYLIAFTMTSMGNAIINSVEWDDGDLINRMQRVIELKLRILEQYPYMLDFGKAMYDSKSLEEVKALAEKYIPDLYPKVYSHNIDYSLFKQTIDVSRAVKMIQLFLDGYSEQLLKKYRTSIFSTKDLKEEMEDVVLYLDMYREAFYKGKESV